MDAVIGLDIGTSSVKGVLVDLRGTILKVASRSYSLITKGDRAEQNPQDWVDATRSILMELGKDSRLLSISFSGQMHSLVALDEFFKPICNAIIWCDHRSTPQVAVVENTMKSR